MKLSSSKAWRTNYLKEVLVSCTIPEQFAQGIASDMAEFVYTDLRKAALLAAKKWWEMD